VSGGYLSTAPYLVLADENGRVTWLQRDTLLEASACFFRWVGWGAPLVRIVDRRGETICWRDVKRGSKWTEEVGELMRRHSPATSELQTILEMTQIELEVLRDAQHR